MAIAPGDCFAEIRDDWPRVRLAILSATSACRPSRSSRIAERPAAARPDNPLRASRRREEPRPPEGRVGRMPGEKFPRAASPPFRPPRSESRRNICSRPCASAAPARLESQFETIASRNPRSRSDESTARDVRVDRPRPGQNEVRDDLGKTPAERVPRSRWCLARRSTNASQKARSPAAPRIGSEVPAPGSPARSNPARPRDRPASIERRRAQRPRSRPARREDRHGGASRPRRRERRGFCRSRLATCNPRPGGCHQGMTWPPSRTIAWPVRFRASSEAMYAASPAISDGSRTRPSGAIRAQIARASSIETDERSAMRR